MEAKSRISNFLFALISAAVLVGSTIGSIQIDRDARKGYGTEDEDKKFVRERISKVSCADWKSLSIWKRYVTERNRLWCEEYVN